MSGTSLEVTCSGADKNLVLTDHTLAASPAYTAVRVHHNSACFHEDIDQAFF